MYKQAPRFLLGLSLGFLSLVGAGCHRRYSTPQVLRQPPTTRAPIQPLPTWRRSTTTINPPPLPAQGAVLGIRSQAPPQQSYEQYPPPQNPPQETAPPPPSDQDQTYQDAQTAAELDQEGETPPVEYADQPPPPLPVYEQPEAPAPNYIWTPGYWYWGPAGYYWIPGRLVRSALLRRPLDPRLLGLVSQPLGLPPRILGPSHRLFSMAASTTASATPALATTAATGTATTSTTTAPVNRVSPHITYVYNRTVVVNNNTRVAYNSGQGGLAAVKTAAGRDRCHAPAQNSAPCPPRSRPARSSAQNRKQFYIVNRGRPAMVAVPGPSPRQSGFTRPNPPGNRPGQPEVRPVPAGRINQQCNQEVVRDSRTPEINPEVGRANPYRIPFNPTTGRRSNNQPAQGDRKSARGDRTARPGRPKVRPSEPQGSETGSPADGSGPTSHKSTCAA